MVAAAGRHFKMLGGVVPCPGGWLIVPGRLAAVTVIIEEPIVLRTLIEVLDYKPKFEAAAIFAPMGFQDEPSGPYRPCDDEARALIGWPRMVSVRPVPSRRTLRAPSKAAALELEPWLTKHDLRNFRWLREAEQAFEPFHQRSWFAAHPELSMYMINGDRPLRNSPYLADGMAERLALLVEKLPGVEDLFQVPPPAGAAQVHVMQAAALLWTARRASGRAVSRVPMDPDWDTNGLRMELVR